jgi:hypothetical protein
VGEFAHYVVESYAQGITVEFQNLFSTVESLFQNPDSELENLIAVGLFEDIQNIASHRDFGAAPFDGGSGRAVWSSGTKLKQIGRGWLRGKHGINPDGGNSGRAAVSSMLNKP